MPITFSCECGEPLTIDDAQRGRKVFCPKCRTSVRVPEDASASEPKKNGGKSGLPVSSEVSEPRHIERVKVGEKQTEAWKLTCVCGKRILSPFHSSLPVGRCPKCGRRMRLPGYRPPTRAERETVRRDGPPQASGKPAALTPGLPETIAGGSLDELKKADAASLDDLMLQPVGSKAPGRTAAATTATLDQAATARAKASTAAMDAALAATVELDEALRSHPHAQDDVGTIVMEGPEIEELQRETAHPNRAAAIKTADLLRKHMVDRAAASGIVSAWPLAGKGPRAISGFIDLTFCTLAAGLVVLLAHLGVLSPNARHPMVLAAAFYTAALINDILLEAAGGAVGRRLVVLVLRERHGSSLDWGRLALRAVLKWILVPGWLIAFVDPAERALHDIVCGTLVLKGRTR